jgi:hypothetical protein
MGIEPRSEARETSVLPRNYARSLLLMCWRIASGSRHSVNTRAFICESHGGALLVRRGSGSDDGCRKAPGLQRAERVSPGLHLAPCGPFGHNDIAGGKFEQVHAEFVSGEIEQRHGNNLRLPGMSILVGYNCEQDRARRRQIGVRNARKLFSERGPCDRHSRCMRERSRDSHFWIACNRAEPAVLNESAGEPFAVKVQ